MAKIKVARPRFIFSPINWEAEEKYNVSAGLFPSKKVITNTMTWVLEHLATADFAQHAEDRIAEKGAAKRPLKEILEGDVVELRFGRYSNSLRAAICRVNCPNWSDVYVVTFSESLQTPNKIEAKVVTSWRNRRSDNHSTLRHTFSKTPVWATTKD